jgi:hypothetical protein
MISLSEKLRVIMNVPVSTSKVFYTVNLFHPDGRKYEISQAPVSGPVLHAPSGFYSLHEGSKVIVKVVANRTGLIDFTVERYNGSRLLISAHLSDRLAAIERKIARKIVPKGTQISVYLVNLKGDPYQIEDDGRMVKLSDTDIRDGSVVRLVEEIL